MIFFILIFLLGCFYFWDNGYNIRSHLYRVNKFLTTKIRGAGK
ncbi:hypothetical protein QWZ13_06085 [Reinekea marina]|nr:hypothetical protein [Reinekea marina]MDN3648476.1 hypothetical protein [Reinekea marina]